MTVIETIIYVKEAAILAIFMLGLILYLCVFWSSLLNRLKYKVHVIEIFFLKVQ